VRDLDGQRRRTREAEAQPATQACLELGVDEAIGQAERNALREAERLAGAEPVRSVDFNFDSEVTL
jgi:hypothetical protein